MNWWAHLSWSQASLVLCLVWLLVTACYLALTDKSN
jgi:hypothetical protein